MTSIETLASWGLAAIAVICLLLLVVGQRTRQPQPRRRMPPPRDATRQLRDVLDAEFSALPVMRHMEYQAFKVVEAEALALRRGLRVFSQTALGAILRTPSDRAFRAINSKRVDALVIGPTGLPLLVVEYQGSGHHQNDAAARDAVKREALRKAGVAFLEVFEHTSEDQIRRQVRDLLALPAPASARPAAPPPRDGAQLVAGPWSAR